MLLYKDYFLEKNKFIIHFHIINLYTHILLVHKLYHHVKLLCGSVNVHNSKDNVGVWLICWPKNLETMFGFLDWKMKVNEKLSEQVNNTNTLVEYVTNLVGSMSSLVDSSNSLDNIDSLLEWVDNSKGSRFVSVEGRGPLFQKKNNILVSIQVWEHEELKVESQKLKKEAWRLEVENWKSLHFMLEKSWDLWERRGWRPKFWKGRAGREMEKRQWITRSRKLNEKI